MSQIQYDLVLFGLGGAFLASALLPRILRGTPVSLPMVYLGLGLLLGLPWSGSLEADPVAHGTLTEHLTELAVIFSLMGAGLKLDRPIGFRRWASTWRLLLVTMPLCIAALTVCGHLWLGMPLAAAVLMGAVLAPTDPVLASSVQVGPPDQGGEDEARFALTSEAGLNDGLAFPFVNLAVVIAATGFAGAGLTSWLFVDVLWKISAGVLVGVLVGRTVALLVFRFLEDFALSDAFLVLALTLLAYGGAELVHGYGFIAVFVAALLFSQHERHHDYHKELHDLTDQMERLLMAAVLILFGAAIADGLFAALTLQGVALGLLFVLVLRPAAALLALWGTPVQQSSKNVIAVYGIRGIGTFYYLAYAVKEMELPEAQARGLWAVAGFIVVLSILFHGTTVDEVMRRFDRKKPRAAS